MNRLSSHALNALGQFYGRLTNWRLNLYKNGTLRERSIDAPVFSVGNITVGGTGKTPLVAWLARTLSQAGKRPCVLTRGYKRLDESTRVVVSDGTRLLADWRTGGDEPRLLAEELLGISAVVSDKRRYAAAEWVKENLDCDAFVLDDGFQHLALRRDLDIVTIDALDPFGGAEMMPRGRLREPLANLSRADCIVVTRADLATNLEDTLYVLRSISSELRIFTARTRTARVTRVQSDDDSSSSLNNADEEAWRNASMFAFCALGNAEAFFAYARREQFAVHGTRAFTDHHSYTQEDVKAIENQARQVGASALLTTKKDAVKLSALRFELPCYVLEIELEINDKAGLVALIHHTLTKPRA